MSETTEVSTLQIGSTKIPYRVRESPSSKYVQLKLKPNFELEILVPRESRVDVGALIKKKRNWITTKYNQMVNSKQIFDGKRLLYQGQPHEVEFSSLEATVKRENGRIIFPVDDSIEPRSALKEWMKTETERLVKNRLMHFGRRLRLPFNGFSVQETKKWAYCTKNQKLVFNWQLAALPRGLSDYVIVHELTHLGEFSHSRRFRYLLASVCPDFKERDAMLKHFIAV